MCIFLYNNLPQFSPSSRFGQYQAITHGSFSTCLHSCGILYDFLCQKDLWESTQTWQWWTQWECFLRLLSWLKLGSVCFLWLSSPLLLPQTQTDTLSIQHKYWPDWKHRVALACRSLAASMGDYPLTRKGGKTRDSPHWHPHDMHGWCTDRKSIGNLNDLEWCHFMLWYIWRKESKCKLMRE